MRLSKPDREKAANTPRTEADTSSSGADSDVRPQNERVARGALVIGLFTLLSRVFGFIRDQVIIHVFGATRVTDVFWIAFTIPNVMRRLVAEGALTVTFVSVYKHVQEESPAAARAFFAEMLALVMVVVTALVVAGVVFAPLLVTAFASGLLDSPDQFSLAVSLTRWLFPYVSFISLVALAMGALNANNHFAAPAAAPVLLNLAIIACAYFLGDAFEQPIFSLAAGVLLGGALQLLLQLPALKKAGLLVLPRLRLSAPVKRFAVLWFPQLFGLAIYQLNVIVLRQVASYLPEGQLTHYYNADRLMQFAYGVFAVAISQAALPQMSEQEAQGRHQDLFDTWGFAIRLTNFVTIPAALGLVAVAMPIISTFYFHGQFDWEDVVSTAACTLAFAPGLIAQGMARATTQVFFAMEDMKTPVLASVVSLASVITFGVLLFQYEVLGLAAALTISGWLQLLVLLGFLVLRTRRRLSSDIRMGLTGLLRSSAAQLALALAAVGPAYLLTSACSVPRDGFTLLNVVSLFGSIGVAIGIYLGGAYILKFPEVTAVVEKLSRKLKR